VVEGERLRYRAPKGALTPELRHALTAYKAELLDLLAHAAADASSIVAVKVWSNVLQDAVWVVADDLPRDHWPTDAPVYTQAEVKILLQVGPRTLAWVHATKTIFNAGVISAKGLGHGRDLSTLPSTAASRVNDASNKECVQ
jgi:hypothetical protein